MAEITKLMNLNLSKVPKSSRNRVKKDIGEFVVNEILIDLEVGKSPVEGETFDLLSVDYADAEKGGDRTPNMELDGDMLDALKFDVNDNGIEIGIFEGSQSDKADGHNNFSGLSKLPQRRFIPESNQRFKKDIMDEVDAIIKRNESALKVSRVPRLGTITNTSSDGETSIMVEDLFDDALKGLF